MNTAASFSSLPLRMVTASFVALALYACGGAVESSSSGSTKGSSSGGAPSGGSGSAGGGSGSASGGSAGGGSGSTDSPPSTAPLPPCSTAYPPNSPACPPDFWKACHGGAPIGLDCSAHPDLKCWYPGAGDYGKDCIETALIACNTVSDGDGGTESYATCSQ